MQEMSRIGWILCLKFLFFGFEEQLVAVAVPTLEFEIYGTTGATLKLRLLKPTKARMGLMPSTRAAGRDDGVYITVGIIQVDIELISRL
jgi:hypothetical protein